MDVDLRTFTLYGRRVLCREITTEETINGGRIIIPEQTRRLVTLNQAEIVAVGSGDMDEDEHRPVDPDLTVGCWILHRSWMRTPTWDEDLFLLHEDDVLGILDAS